MTDVSARPSPSNVKTALPMKLFEDLASVSQDVRVAAVDKLERHLLSHRENKEVEDKSAAEATDIAYTVKRLVRGLASNRKMARVGFATALANCLSKQCVPLTDTLASLSDPTSGAQFLKTSSTMGKADRTHTLIGQLFFVATVAKGILGTGSKKIEANDVTKLASLCVDAFKQKPVLRQMACSILGQFITAAMSDEESASNNASAIFKVVQPLLNGGWPNSSSDIDTADLLLLAIIVEPVAPPSFWSENSWLSSESAQPRQSFIYSLLSDSAKVAAVIASARHTPFVHLAAVKLFDMISSQLSHRKMKKRFFTFWSELVNEHFLLPTSATSHKTAALQLGIVALTTFLRQAPGLISVVLSPQMIQLLSSSLRRPHCAEREAVLAFFDELISALSVKKDAQQTEDKAEPNENYHLAIFASFMRPPTRVWNEFPDQFDKMLHASPPATMAKVSELMKSIAATQSFSFDYETGDIVEEVEEEKDEPSRHFHRWEDEGSAMAARRWAVAHLASNIALSSPVQSSGDVVSIISTVFESCLFVDKSSPQSDGHSKAQKIGLFPREQAVSHVLRVICGATSPGIAPHLAGMTDCISILKPVLGFLKTRIGTDDEESSVDSMISPLVGEAKKVFLSLLKNSKKKTEPESVLELLRLFACHAAVLLVCYPNDKDIVQLGNEISDLFTTVAQSEEDESAKDGPARVFLDMLIGLLSRKSRPIRQVTTSMFSKLISNRRLFALLTSSSNADSDTQASSLVDLIVNALLNTQFVEDNKEGCDSSDEDNDGDGDDECEKDEGNGDDGGDGDGMAKKLKSKRKRTTSGHIVASTAPVNNDEDEGDNLSSADSVLMNDEEMFGLDNVFAAAVRAATAGGGPAKRAKREKKNQLQEMKEFHMKLVSWLEMVIHKAQQIAKEDDSTCDGNKIVVDVIGILLNTLANKKRTCSPTIEIRFCELIRLAVNPWRQTKAIEDGTIGKVAKSLSPTAEMILDASLQIVRNMSAIPPKLEAAAFAVEVLMLCAETAASPAVKSKSIVAALQNSIETYLAHPSPHGHVFFSALLSSTRLQLKQLERIFFDRLLSCLAGRETEKAGDGNDKNAPSKAKSFPRSQAARLFANSQLVTVDAYSSRPRICQELGLVLEEVIKSFATDVKEEKEELIKEPKKPAQQPFLYRNIIDLVKRHCYAVLKDAGTERATKLEAFAQLAVNIEAIRDNSLGKKSADIRQACAGVLKVIGKKPQQKQKEKTPEVKKEAKATKKSATKRRNDSKSDDATPEKMSRDSEPSSEKSDKSKSSSAKKRTRSSTNVDS